MGAQLNREWWKEVIFELSSVALENVSLTQEKKKAFLFEEKKWILEPPQGKNLKNVTIEAFSGNNDL